MIHRPCPRLAGDLAPAGSCWATTAGSWPKELSSAAIVHHRRRCPSGCGCPCHLVPHEVAAAGWTPTTAWTPSDDSAPESKPDRIVLVSVLVERPGSAVLVPRTSAGWLDGDTWRALSATRIRVTHWRELPPPAPLPAGGLTVSQL